MNSGSYVDRQHQRDRQYAEAWETLSATERKELQKAGITGPELPVYATGKDDQQTLLESCVASLVTEANSAANAICTQRYAPLEVARRIVAELAAQNNVQLTADCLSLVTGISYDGSSMAAIAKRYRISRAAVSKRCVEISNALALPPSRAMRQLTTRMTYADHAKQYHHRNSH